MCVVVVVVMLFVVVKENRSVTCFQTHGDRTRLVLWLCMFELTIKTQTAEYHSGVAARRERRWQDRPLAASPRGYWCSVSSVLVSVSLC